MTETLPGLPAPKPPRLRLTAPVPVERDIHQACAHALDRLLLPDAFWFSYPAGASVLSPQQIARHSRIGLKRGLPDIFVIHGGLYGIELKRPGGKLSKTRIGRTARGAPRMLAGQVEVFGLLLAAGMKDIAVCHSVEEMLATLQRWKIPLRRFDVR